MAGVNGWGYSGYGFGPFHLIIWVIVLTAIVALVVWLVRSLGAGGHQLLPRRPIGLDVLEERYTRGEINRDEYLQKKRDMGGSLVGVGQLTVGGYDMRAQSATIERYG